MLTAITIENFKGIGDPVTIPIRPLTIMFGKNSAGKSTVVQALHYAREVLLHNNPNPDRTTLGGTSMDLGGFRELVHNNDLTKPIVMRFNFDLSASELPEYQSWEADWEAKYQTNVLNNSGSENDESNHDRQSFIQFREGMNLYDKFYPLQERRKLKGSPQTSASLEFSVVWSEAREAASVTSYRTWLCGEPAGHIDTASDERNLAWKINISHSLLGIEDLDKSGQANEIVWREVPFSQWHIPKPLPEWGKAVEFAAGSDLFDLSIGHNTVAQLLVAPGDLLMGYLQEPGLNDMRYIGPIREIPPRHFHPPNKETESLWSMGIAAWNRLYKGGDELIKEVGEILGSSFLKTGYTLALDRYREIPLDSDLMIALQNGSILDQIDDTSEAVRQFPILERLKIVEEKTGLKLLPHDIGVGISQVIPVVVAALDSANQFVAIEQPELHLHPAVQAELGDLFIVSMQERYNVFIIETHSEHLILRILRRIRESSEGEESVNVDPIFPEDVSLIFVEPNDTGTTILEIPITSEGDFAKNVPGGFFAERAEELF